MRRKQIHSMVLENMSFGFERAGLLFENISIELPKSRAIWVRSPGGRGKSTLLRLLAGLMSPTDGRYLINGEDVGQMSFEDFLPYRLSMGYGFDMGGLINNMTIFENLALPLRYHKFIDESEIAERIEQVVEIFGMGQSRGSRPFAVSGSQRKLTCVIRAFIHWPQVVFLDDAMTGLKEDNLNDLIYFVEEAFATRGLKHVFFTSESPVLADRLKAEELLISGDWFTTRAGA
ncbi:MAG TPA: ATP-binding cassette domain-containing protein [Bdellovibrionales bacterium]|nr:ATP-binding cassette domain-containing protein [Bdellovibrionales bacterium]